MKSKLTLFAIVFLSISAVVSCSKKGSGESDEGGSIGDVPGMSSTTHGWELTSWNGDAAITGYVYLQFKEEGVFTLYQQVGDYAKAGYEKFTGTYMIKAGSASTRIISGRYSDNTPWEDTYEIESWTDQELRWRSVSGNIVSIYRWTELPDYVTEPSVSIFSRGSVSEQRFL